MTDEKPNAGTRGQPPRGSFETAKAFTTATENTRVEAAKRKPKALRAARLAMQRQNGGHQDAPN